MTNGSILIVGDPGPAGDQILARNDLEVLWATGPDEAASILHQERPRVCLVSPSVGKLGARRTLEVVGDCHGIPCILLVSKNEAPIDARVASRCVAVVPIDQCESILGLVGAYMSLRFARHARVPFIANVRTSVFGEERLVESANIAESGIALRNLPRVPEGTLIRLSIEPSDLPPIQAVARVVRFANDGLAGLEFVDLPAEQRDRIAKLVESKLERSKPGRLRIEDLFTTDLSDAGANQALRTSDLMPPSADDGEQLESTRFRALLRGMMVGDLKAASEAPAWLSRVAREITNIEGDEIMGIQTPAWVSAALDMRIRLAERRAEGEQQPSSPDAATMAQRLGLEAYRLFVRLAEEARHEPGQVVAQIARIRAAILRDLLSGQPRERSAATPPRSEAPLEVLEPAIDNELKKTG
jgi:PilZ domain-containing protein